MLSESTPTGDAAEKWLRELSLKRDPNYRLGQIVNKKYIEGLSSIPEFKDHTITWLLYRTMLEKQWDEGAQMDEDARIRLGTLIAVFRIVARPIMNPEEQEDIGLFFITKHSAMLDREELREAVRDVLDDLELISNTFDMPLNLEN